MEARDIILQFLATEKSTIAKETEGKYAFAVDARANKYQIRDAFEKLYKVEVASVRTMTMPGKVKRLGRNQGKTPIWKKAIIKLKGEGQIAEFDNL